MEDLYFYPELGEELGPYQPNLEYKQNDGTWLESGLISGKLRKSFLGYYRVKLIKELVMVDTKTIRKNLGNRKSIALMHDDVIELLNAYELAVGRNPQDFNDDIADQLGMNFPSDFDAKH